MKQPISVDKAIKQGHLMVNAPVFIAIIGCPALALFLFKQNLIPGWGIGLAIPIGFVLAWLIWSIMITKWRIWAFEKVRNVHELKKRAVEENLIWREGSVFEKTELRGSKDRAKLKNLERKFAIEDEHREDHSLPPKMEIFYSKSYNYLELGVSIFIIGVGIYFLLKGETRYYILGSIMSAIGIFSTVKESRKALNNKPQITVDINGIKSIKVGFKNWSTIENEEVIKDGFGKSQKTYLTYFYDEVGYEKIEIDSLNVSYSEMENIIRTYRLRNKKNYR